MNGRVFRAGRAALFADWQAALAALDDAIDQRRAAERLARRIPALAAAEAAERRRHVELEGR